VVDTVFNCFAYAEKITGLRTMEFFRENPAAFHEGMSRVAESLARWAETAVKAGAAGIYLAVQGATADIMSEDEYRCEFLPYDRIVLQRIHDAAALNVVHIHSEDIHWRVWDALPFHALSWSSNITPPSIAEARQSYDGCIMAGVNEVAIGGYTPEQVIREIHEAIEATGGRGLIATCGCAVPTDCPPANLHAFKQAVTG
jgi:uroporphyrinogen decarboxylase